MRQIIAHSKNAVHQKILIDCWGNSTPPFRIVTKLGMLKETVHIDSKIERCRKVIKIEIPNQGQGLGFEPCHILERPNRCCPTRILVSYAGFVGFGGVKRRKRVPLEIFGIGHG